jgi:hypothetical protein
MFVQGIVQLFVHRCGDALKIKFHKEIQDEVVQLIQTCALIAGKSSRFSTSSKVTVSEFAALYLEGTNLNLV